MNFEIYQDFFKKAKNLLNTVPTDNNKVNVFSLPAIPNRQQDFITSVESVIFYGSETENKQINLIIPSSIEYMEFIPEEMNNIPIGVCIKTINHIGRVIAQDCFLFKKERNISTFNLSSNWFFVASFIYDNTVINQQ